MDETITVEKEQRVLADGTREMTLHIVTTPPVSHFLKVGAFYASLHQSPVPISYIEQRATLLTAS